MQNRIRLPPAHKDIKLFAKSFFTPFSLVLPILLLYVFDPNSFQSAWKGRFPYLFFLWLFFLEFVLAWGKLPKSMLGTSKWARTLATTVTMAVPTAFAIGTYMFGLREEIIEIGSLFGLPPFGYQESFLTVHWPLSFEYLFFAIFFTASILLTYGIKGVKRFPVSLFFVGAVGSFYMIDTFYPYGTLIALQSLVPFTASSAVNILNGMGYETQLFSYSFTLRRGGMSIEQFVSTILIEREGSTIFVGINWPCAGVHSLLIYTFVVLLFLRGVPFSVQREMIHAAIPKRLKRMAGNNKMAFPRPRRAIRAGVMVAKTLIVEATRMAPLLVVFAVGAVGTFFVNVLRIVSICTIWVNVGPEAAHMFHTYYGELYFIVWIMLYLSAIFFGPKILTKLASIRSKTDYKS